MLVAGLRLLLQAPSLATVEPGSQKCQGKEVISERMVCLCGSERRLVLCKGEGSSGVQGVSQPSDPGRLHVFLHGPANIGLDHHANSPRPASHLWVQRGAWC